MRLRTLPWALVVLGTLACSTGPNRLVRAEYQRNRDAWNDAGLQTYSYQLFVSCFCPIGPSPAVVSVDNGTITSVVWADTTGSGGRDPDSLYGLTIDDLFDVVANAIEVEADELLVEYDADRNFPATISIDFYFNAIDDEVSYTVSAFTEGPIQDPPQGLQ